MKILKSNTSQLFDTSNIELVEIYIGKIPEFSQVLHQNHNETDLEFLRRFFPANHRIFSNFGDSFYYLIEK